MTRRSLIPRYVSVLCWDRKKKILFSVWIPGQRARFFCRLPSPVSGQNMDRQRHYNEDILNYTVRDDTVYLMLFNIYKGTLWNKNEFVFPASPEFLEEFLLQYYSENPVPRELINRRRSLLHSPHFSQSVAAPKSSSPSHDAAQNASCSPLCQKTSS